MSSKVSASRRFASSVLCATVCLAVMASGCDNKEKVLEIETPSTSVDVERDRSTGEVDVQVDKNP